MQIKTHVFSGAQVLTFMCNCFIVYCVSADADDTPSHCNSTVEYACANERTCIALELVNNSVNDCGDNSDEGKCDINTPHRYVYLTLKASYMSAR